MTIGDVLGLLALILAVVGSIRPDWAGRMWESWRTRSRDTIEDTLQHMSDVSAFRESQRDAVLRWLCAGFYWVAWGVAATALSPRPRMFRRRRPMWIDGLFVYGAGALRERITRSKNIHGKA